MNNTDQIKKEKLVALYQKTRSNIITLLHKKLTLVKKISQRNVDERLAELRKDILK